MEEDVRNTVLVIHNYDGEDLGEFRRNLATFGAIKVRSYDGRDGSVETLEIKINSENFQAIIELLKKSIIENARGFDAKDDRLNGSPNQLNIRSMYSDIDLDANEIEIEFQAAFEELLWFINQYLATTGQGAYDAETATVIFDRDILINESEAIENCVKSEGILSKETIVKMHPWVTDPTKELERIKSEEEEAQAADPYRAAFEANRANGALPEGGGVSGAA
jgi:SPP1 family phage portal protein